MNIKWDHFVSQYDAARYVSSGDGRDNRHIQFVREFASVVSVLQASCGSSSVVLLIYALNLYEGQDDQRHRSLQGYPPRRRRPLHMLLYD